MNNLFLFVFFYLFNCCNSFASPYPVEKVFTVQIQNLNDNSFKIFWQIKPNHFLYKNKIKLTIYKAHSTLHLSPLQLPKAILKIDKLLAVNYIYRNNISLPISVSTINQSEKILTLQFQGCSDAGFCYPPQKRQLKLSFDSNLTLTKVKLLNASKLSENKTTLIKKSFFFKQQRSIAIIGFFFLGIIAAFTPCMLPMLPVLSAILVAHGNKLSSRKSFFLALSYVLSMSITYAFIGGTVALLGFNLQIIMQSPWVVSLFSLLFILLGLSLLGFNMPTIPISFKTYTYIRQLSCNHAKGSYLGAGIMGSLSILILSPCVSAPLIAILGYIAKKGELGFGSLTLFFYSLGLGTPLLLISTCASQWLPRTGKWMYKIQAFFGILLLLLAISLIIRMIPTHFLPFTSSSSNFQVVKTVTQATKYIHNTNKPVIIEFYANWCNSCRIIESTFFKNLKIKKYLDNFLLLKIDLTQNNSETRAILAKFKVIAPPSFLFFTKHGKERKNLRLTGEITSSTFLTQLQVFEKEGTRSF